MKRERHPDFTPRRDERAGVFRCPECGTTLRGRSGRELGRADQAQRCRNHPDAMPVAMTRQRENCLAAIEGAVRNGEDVDAFVLKYAQKPLYGRLIHRHTTLDGMREMAIRGRAWGLLPRIQEALL